jgi:hypothetical protein
MELCLIRPTLLWEFETNLAAWLEQRELVEADSLLAQKIKKLQQIYSENSSDDF